MKTEGAEEAMPRLDKLWPILKSLWSILFTVILLGIFVSYLYAALFDESWTGEFRPEALEYFGDHWPWVALAFGLLLLITLLTVIDRRRRFDNALLTAATVGNVRDLRPGLWPGSGDISIPDYRLGMDIERTVDGEARRAFDQCGCVLIIGRPLSGKTHTAWNLVRNTPNVLLVVPRQGEPPSFTPSGFHGKEIVLFFDDVHLVTETGDPLLWWDRLSTAAGRPCRAIFTARDGADLDRLEERQPLLIRRFNAACRVYTSSSGGHGSDLTPSEGRQLSKLLGLNLDEQAFVARFDGTPGSLTLDLAEMGARYRRLQRERVGGALASRLLDAAKLLHRAAQPWLSESVLRAVSERILDDEPLGQETWRILKRRTEEEGFGSFVDGEFRTYRPYLERPECVDYQPTDAEVAALVPILIEERSFDGLVYLAFVLFTQRISLQAAEVASRKALAAGYSSAQTLLGLVLQSQERFEEAEEAYRAAAQAGHLDALNNLGSLLVDQPNRFEEAIAVWAMAADRGVSAAWVNLGRQLAKQPGSQADAVGAFKLGIRAGYSEAWFDLGYLLSNLPHKRKAAEWAYRCAIASGVAAAYSNLGLLLTDIPEREAEAEQIFRDGIDAGDIACYNNLAGLLLNRSNTVTAEVEEMFTIGAANEHLSAVINLAGLRAMQPEQREQHEQRLRQGAAEGSPLAALGLGVFLCKSGEIDHDDEKQREGCVWLKRAADASVPQADKIFTEFCTAV